LLDVPDTRLRTDCPLRTDMRERPDDVGRPSALELGPLNA
jgi:hypothetical protein